MGERIKEAALPASIVTAAALIGGGFYAGGNSGVSIGEMSRTMTRMEGTLAKMDAKLDPLGDQVASDEPVWILPASDPFCGDMIREWCTKVLMHPEESLVPEINPLIAFRR